MKKISVFLVSLFLILCMAGAANALVFTDTQLFGFPGIGVSLSGTGTYTWEHDTPADFSVPPDTVNSATLEVFGYLVSGSNDTVAVEGVFQGILTNLTWSWFSIEGTTLDIADVFTSWEAGEVLNVALNFNETGRWNNLMLSGSVFRLDYEQGGANTAPVPEPTTLLLIGTGLLGLVGANRRRFGKKA